MIALVLAAVLFVGAFVVATRSGARPASRLEPLGTPARPANRVAHVARRTADDVIDRNGRRETFESLLEDADVALKPSEALLVAAAAMFFALVAGLAVLGLAGGLLLPAMVGGIGWLVLVRRRESRRSRFADQLPDVLTLLSGNLRVGYGLLQAIETATRETDSPMADELRRATNEIRLGRDLVAAMTAIAERMASEDFGWVVQAMAINTDVGGDLAEVLDGVADTIRDRAALGRQVRALSAEGRMSAYVLVALPIGVGLLNFLTNRDYALLLFTTAPGLLMSVTGGVLMVAGCLWLRRLVRPVY